MYDSWHDIEVIRNSKILSRDILIEQTVTGNICESGDILARDRMLPEIKGGDLVCVLDAGAYGWCMASCYNTRPRPAEVLICADGNIRVIRRRETIEDMVMLF